VNALHWFAHPWAFWMLLLLPALGALAIYARLRRRRVLAQVGNRLMLDKLTPVRPWPRRLRAGCGAVAIVLVVLGTAGPQWGRDWDQPAPGRDLIVLLDVSRTMLAEDVPPNRLGRARESLIELSRVLQQRGGYRVALVVFAGRALVVCPLTRDYDHFRDAVEHLDTVLGRSELRPGKGSPSGTRFGAGLREAVLAHDPRFHGFQEILMISDGDDPVRDEEWRIGVREAQTRRIPVHTLGVGDPREGGRIPVAKGFLRDGNKEVRTRLEEQPLREIARLTGGTYTPAETKVVPLEEWFRTTVEPRPAPDQSDELVPIPRQRYAWFFAAALLFLTFEMVLGHRPKRMKTPMNGEKTTKAAPAVAAGLALMLIGAAGPADSEACLHRGNAAYDQGNFLAALDWYTKAEERTTDPGLVAYNKAAALYRLGDYRAAELSYRCCLEDAEGVRRARALYDLGNSLLQRSRGSEVQALADAILAYEQCLKQEAADPELCDDARFNRDLARSLWLLAKAAEKPPGADPSNPDPYDPFAPFPRHDRGRFGSFDLNPSGLNPDGTSGEPPAGPSNPLASDQPPPPGAGNRPPLPDQGELVPLAPEDAEAHLHDAVTRIRQSQTQRLGVQAAAPRNVLDR
jgi:Ca-activated chloride channel family protein